MSVLQKNVLQKNVASFDNLGIEYAKFMNARGRNVNPTTLKKIVRDTHDKFVKKWLSFDVWNVVANYVGIAGCQTNPSTPPTTNSLREGYQYGLSIFGMPYGIWRRFSHVSHPGMCMYETSYETCSMINQWPNCVQVSYDVVVENPNMFIYADPKNNPVVHKSYMDAGDSKSESLYTYVKYRPMVSAYIIGNINAVSFYWHPIEIGERLKYHYDFYDDEEEDLDEIPITSATLSSLLGSYKSIQDCLQLIKN